MWIQKRRDLQESRILWLDLGDLGVLARPGDILEKWQDHGLGLLRTLLHQKGILTDLASTRAATSWRQVGKVLRDRDLLLRR